MKRFFSSLRKDVKISFPVFKSEVHAQSATNTQRQQWLKKRSEMISTSNASTSTNNVINNTKVIDSNGFVNNSVVKKAGLDRYEMQQVQSSADIYRQMRANGQLGQLNSGLGQANISPSSSSSSIWSSTIGLITILGAAIAWNMTQSTTLLDTTDIAIALDTTNNVSSDIIIDPNYSKQPLWLQRRR